MGAQVGGKHRREQSSSLLTVHKGDVGRAVSLLGDVFSNATLDSAELELEKQRHAAVSENESDLEKVSLE